MARLIAHGAEIVRAILTTDYPTEQITQRTTRVLCADGWVLEKVQIRDHTAVDPTRWTVGRFRRDSFVPVRATASTWADGQRSLGWTVDIVAPHLMQTPLRVGR